MTTTTATTAAATTTSSNSSVYSASVLTEAETVKVINNEQTMAALQQQQAREDEKAKQQQQQQQQQQKTVVEQEEQDDYAPMSCIDNACEAMIGLFGAGSDAQDKEMEETYNKITYGNMVSNVNVKVTPENQAQKEKEEETVTFALDAVSPPQDNQAQPKEPPTPVTPVTKRTFSFVTNKKTKSNKSSNNNKKKQGRIAPTGVTVDDDQVEGRRKSKIGRWWKKKFQKDTKQRRSKSVPRRRTRSDTVPPSPSTVASHMQASQDDQEVADYVDMSSVYSHGQPQEQQQAQGQASPSAASFQPRNRVRIQDLDDSDDDQDDGSLNVWKELNDMWEESGHDLVRVVSDNISVNEETTAAAMEEQDIMAKYEQAVAAEGLLEAAQGRQDKNRALEVTV